MFRTTVLVLCTLSISYAIRCFSGQQTVGNGFPAMAYQQVDCQDSDFCFDNYVKRNHNGDDTFTITKSCGEPGKCFETGCEGPGDEKRCCCAGDLCNSSNAVVLSTAAILAIVRPFL